jgi:hypothetical protein
VSGYTKRTNQQAANLTVKRRAYRLRTAK